MITDRIVQYKILNVISLILATVISLTGLLENNIFLLTGILWWYYIIDRHYIRLWILIPLVVLLAYCAPWYVHIAILYFEVKEWYYARGFKLWGKDRNNVDNNGICNNDSTLNPEHNTGDGE